MKKKMFFISFILLCFLIPVIAYSSIDDFIVTAYVDNPRIEVGDTTKVGFTATYTNEKRGIDYSISIHDYDFDSNDGLLSFDEDAVKSEYSSSNSNIATVDAKGVVTGLSPGTITITQKITFNINKISVSERILNDYQDSARVSCNRGNPFAVTMTASDLAAMASGHNNETITREVKVTVTAPGSLYLCRFGAKPVPVKLASNMPSDEISGLTVGGSSDAGFSMTFTEINDPTVKYTFSNKDYSHLAPLSFLATYASDNSAVAAVDKNGRVTGVSKGQATVTVKLTFVLGDCNLVTPKEEGIVRLATAPGTKYKVLELTRRVTYLVHSADCASGNYVLTQGESVSLPQPLYFSDDPSTVSVSNGNTPTGLHPGRVALVYFINDKGNYPTPIEGFVTVVPVMAIYPETVLIYSDAQKELKVTFDSWYDGKKSGKWSVADTNIASIDQNGVVTGIKAGTTTATFTLDGSGANTSCTVVVKEPPLQLTPALLTLDVGAVGTLNVTFDSSYTGARAGTWSVADSAIASVSGYETSSVKINARHTVPGIIGAKITALKSGTTKVTFTHPATGVTLSVPVTVKPGFSVSPNPLTVYEGETGSLSAVFDDGYTDSRNGRWLIDDSTVASVDQNGVVTGKKSGTAVASYMIIPDSSAAKNDAVTEGITKVIEQKQAMEALSRPVKTAIINVKPGSFTVTFSGADTNPPTVTVKHDTTVPKPPNPSPSSDDVRFVGWSASPSGWTIWDFDNNKVTQDMTLYAQWAMKITTTYVSVTIPSTITGPDTIALSAGYTDTHQAYTLSGTPTPSLAITTNTAGATLSGNTLTIPAGLAAGSYSVTLQASNSVSPAATKTVQIFVIRLTPTTINVSAGAKNYLESLYIFDNVSGRTYSFSLDNDPPSWVELSASALILSPPSGTSGNFQVDVVVTDEDGNSVTISVTITVT